MPSSGASPPPIWVILPDRQDVVGYLRERQQTPDGWLYKVSVPAWRNEDGRVEPAWYTVWVQAPVHVRPVDGVSYDSVPTERIARPSSARKILGPRRPTGWVLQRLDGKQGPGRGILHAPDCDEAPRAAPVLKVERALDAAEKAGVRLCTLCGAAQELEPLLQRFDHGFDPDR